MARERMVTRTITVTTYSVLGINLDTQKAETRTAEISGGVDAKTAEKLVREYYANTPFAIALISPANTIDVLYGMPESEFIKFAKPLPPRSSNDD